MKLEDHAEKNDKKPQIGKANKIRRIGALKISGFHIKWTRFRTGKTHDIVSTAILKNKNRWTL